MHVPILFFCDLLPTQAAIDGAIQPLVLEPGVGCAILSVVWRNDKACYFKAILWQPPAGRRPALPSVAGDEDLRVAIISRDEEGVVGREARRDGQSGSGEEIAESLL